MESSTDLQPTEDLSLIRRLLTIYNILTNYIWIFHFTLGVPGNMLTICVANRKHNRHLSPCTFISAMALADTMVLLSQSLCVPWPTTFWGIGAYIDNRDILFQ